MHELCLRAIKVESATASFESAHRHGLPDSMYLCLRPLPCDSDEHLHPAHVAPAAAPGLTTRLRTFIGSLGTARG